MAAYENEKSYLIPLPDALKGVVMPSTATGVPMTAPVYTTAIGPSSYVPGNTASYAVEHRAIPSGSQVYSGMTMPMQSTTTTTTGGSNLMGSNYPYTVAGRLNFQSQGQRTFSQQRPLTDGHGHLLMGNANNSGYQYNTYSTQPQPQPPYSAAAGVMSNSAADCRYDYSLAGTKGLPARIAPAVTLPASSRAPFNASAAGNPNVVYSQQQPMLQGVTGGPYTSSNVPMATTSATTAGRPIYTSAAGPNVLYQQTATTTSVPTVGTVQHPSSRIQNYEQPPVGHHPTHLPTGQSSNYYYAQPPSYQTPTQPQHHHQQHDHHQHQHSNQHQAPHYGTASGVPSEYPQAAGASRTRKFVVKHQRRGCCGCCNRKGCCDKPGGKCGCLNCGGCCDREVMKYKRFDDFENASVEEPKEAGKKKGC